MILTRFIRKWPLSSGVTISLLLHLLLAGALLVVIEPETLPPQDEVVEVTLVAPPPAVPEAAEKPAPEEPAPAVEEPPSEPEPAPEPAPAPEPEPAPETQPEPEQPQEQASAAQEEPALPEGVAAPIPVLRPVVQFGDQDRGGSEVSPLGEDAGATDGTADEPVEDPAEAAAEPPAGADVPVPEPDKPAVPELSLPEADMRGSMSGAEEAPIETLSPSGERVAVTRAEIEEAALEPRKVPKLFSTAISDDAMAMTAMGMMSRQERGDQLCGTELSQQLRRGKPAYAPYLLPILRIGDGSVADVPLAAFQEVSGDWINIAVRCEVDADATRVVDFSLSIGAPVPRSEWKARGFPVR